MSRASLERRLATRGWRREAEDAAIGSGESPRIGFNEIVGDEMTHRVAKEHRLLIRADALISATRVFIPTSIPAPVETAGEYHAAWSPRERMRSIASSWGILNLPKATVIHGA
ncbi:hypothetical protein HN011_005471 [Eciton burchellii]|nr:hypothetical protein HN011_005471 [Eciton burchellii]